MQDALEARIIDPCLEFMEKRERKKDRTKDYTEYLMQKRKELYNRFQAGDVILPRMVAIVGTKCTLRCKDCANLMQYYDRPYDIEIDDLLNDLEQLFKKVDYCVCINIVGGEPLIYPHLDELLDYLIKSEKVGSIELVSNATRVPDEKVLDKLRNPKVLLEISDYGDIEKMSKFIAAMDKWQVRMHISVDLKWIDYGGCKPRNRDQATLKELYTVCRSGKMCKALFKGKIFDCPRSAHLLDLGCADNIDNIDIYKCSKSDIISFWLKEYARACDYCDLSLREKQYVEPAVQVGGKPFERSSCTIIPREDYEEIWQANGWYRQQLDNYQKRVAELEDQIGELQRRKTGWKDKIIRGKKDNYGRNEHKDVSD